MPVSLTYGEIADEFSKMQQIFRDSNPKPFVNIVCRPAHEAGKREWRVQDLINRRRGLPYRNGVLLPDESEYVAVITLSTDLLYPTSRTVPATDSYVFKIRPDGAVCCSPVKRFYKQSPEKWLNLISKFITGLPFGTVQRQSLIKESVLEELVMVANARNPDLLWA
jgi:hypothetical protein